MKDYNEKTHLYGRFWVISALFIFLMLPVAISAHLHAFPSAPGQGAAHPHCLAGMEGLI